MATLPFFVFGPNAILSIIGLMHGPDTTVPTPRENWHKMKVDAVIPAYNEEKTVILCLESLLRQTLRPQRIILIDDGSKDRTAEIARAFAKQNHFEIEVIRHRKSVGKTPGVKQEARELDGDVEFVLDGDTILESENYIERLVQELYQGVGIACACGVIMPLRNSDRKKLAATGRAAAFYKERPELPYLDALSAPHRLLRGITNIYREFLYFFLQKFIYRGYMVMFGSIINPVGCAVAYRREYIRKLFDQYEKQLGDDLTTSEDIFIGFALIEQGYRNIQVSDVRARSQEPEAQGLPRQVFKWSSAFLQSCYYFPDLLKSPFKVFARMRQRSEEKKSGVKEKRKVHEAYRQAFGKEYAQRYGRPMGWPILFALFEKVAFPLFVLFMLVLGHYHTLLLTLAAETGVLLVIAMLISGQYRLRYLLLSVAATPLRYAAMMFDLAVMARFAADVLFFKDHRWRK